MVSAKCHTVKAFDADLLQIGAMTCQAGGLAEMAIHGALDALLQNDEAAAARVIGADSHIHLITREIENQCICLIALRAPMADDLRAVLASFQVAILIERIGDCARGIAEQVPRVPRQKLRNAMPLLRSAACEVSNLVRSALDSFAGKDGAKAKLVCRERERVQSLNEQLFRDLLDTITDDPQTIENSGSLLVISQKLDRIGDDAINIGRVVYFLSTGERYPSRRPTRLPMAEDR